MCIYIYVSLREKRGDVEKNDSEAIFFITRYMWFSLQNFALLLREKRLQYSFNCQF